ncbi:MAG: hypothetical protein WC637_23475 [Victivallales bacterium]|jgi:hypothetical protein
MRKTTFILAALVVFSFLSVEPVNADEGFRGGGGFMIGRIAAKKLKKMREQENFGGADQNRDGKLDRKEAESAKKTHGNFIDEETFKKIDSNGDGTLSHEECEKFQKEMDKEESKPKAAPKPEANTDKDAKN